MIKKQYLGAEKVKKKMLKPSEKFKFNFDWEAADDTSRWANKHWCLRSGVICRYSQATCMCMALPGCRCSNSSPAGT